jgi:hypothetical protein
MAELRVNGELARFLRELAARRFDWASCNCLTVCADWVLRATGRDPAAPWRGRLGSKADAIALVAEFGGLENFAQAAMSSIGARTLRPEMAAAGDVAIVPSSSAAPMGAICVAPDRFAFLTVDLGLMVASRRVLRAWSIWRG